MSAVLRPGSAGRPRPGRPVRARARTRYGRAVRSAVESLEAFAAFVDASPLGVVATVDAEGRPEAALLGLAVTPAGDLLFDARADSRKMTNIARTPQVAVVIGCTGDVSLQVEGDAVVESGAARTAAAALYEGRFPGSHALADGFSIVRVRPRWIRHYDAGVEPAVVVEGAPVWAEQEQRPRARRGETVGETIRDPPEPRPRRGCSPG